jgi:hypothetical protein
MVNQNLLDYIKKSREKGLSNGQISAQLQRVGWDFHLVDEAFEALDSPTLQSSPLQVSVPQEELQTKNLEQNKTISTENKTSVLAIISLVFAIIFCPVGLILSIVALVKIKKTKQKGKGFAVAGLVISIIFLLLAVAAGAFIFYKMTSGINKMGNTLAAINADLLVAQYNDSNGVEHININSIPNGTIEFVNACYSSVIADQGRVEELDCGVKVYGPDVYGLKPMEYFTVLSIIPDLPEQDAQYGARLTKEYVDQEMTSLDANYIESTLDQISINGNDAYVLKWRNGAYNYRSYFLDTPTESNYLVDGQRIGSFKIDGFNGDPETDIFTQQLDLFIDNLKFI